MAQLQAAEKAKEFTMQTRDTPPLNFEMKIKRFSLLSKYGIRKYKSREFEAGGCKWRLIIYLDGDKSVREGDHISAYLSVVIDRSSLPVNWEVKAIFNISLLNQALDNYLCIQGQVQRFTAMKSKWGISRFISKKDLLDPSNGYLIADNCVFGADVFVNTSPQRVMECVSPLREQTPFKRDWNIPEFPKLEGVWKSEGFFVGDLEWRIELYPDGNGSGKGHCSTIFLTCVDAKSFDPHQKVHTSFNLRVQNQRYPSHETYFSHWYTSSSCSWEYDLIRIADVRDSGKGFGFGDFLFLRVEISVQVVVRDVPKSE